MARDAVNSQNACDADRHAGVPIAIRRAPARNAWGAPIWPRAGGRRLRGCGQVAAVTQIVPFTRRSQESGAEFGRPQAESSSFIDTSRVRPVSQAAGYLRGRPLRAGQSIASRTVYARPAPR